MSFSRWAKAGTMAGLLGLVAGCGIPPEGTTPADVARFESAVASIGCDMVSESDYLPVELQAGLTREQSSALVSYMLATGKAARLENGGVRVTSGACAPDV